MRRWASRRARSWSEPASYAVLPQKTNRYARAKGATSLILTSTGPVQITCVNPNDDPRDKK